MPIAIDNSIKVYPLFAGENRQHIESANRSLQRFIVHYPFPASVRLLLHFNCIFAAEMSGILLKVCRLREKENGDSPLAPHRALTWLNRFCAS
jgi:hypothetical protein